MTPTDEGGTYRRIAEALLVAHQRRNITFCLCGWSELGKSWAAHVAKVLDDAGALRKRPPMKPTDGEAQ
jgi:hypothetical protein